METNRKKEIKQHRNLCYIFSMLFFILGFIDSIFIVFAPFLLLAGLIANSGLKRA